MSKKLPALVATVNRSEPNLPVNAALPVLSVAVVKVSYTLLADVMPVMALMLAGVMSPTGPDRAPTTLGYPNTAALPSTTLATVTPVTVTVLPLPTFLVS